MAITSFWFFAFVAISLIFYYLAPMRSRWIVLLISSILFFAFTCGWALYIGFLTQVFIAWCGAYFLDDKNKNKKLSAGITIAIEVIALVIMKENSFFIDNTNAIFNTDFPLPDWVAPLGMSYYTLMLISYIANVMWGKAEAQKNPLKLALYAGFFPQMLSGPFTRYEEMSSQLYEGNSFDLEQIQFGIQRFLWGLFKKLVLAERLAVVVAFIYDGGLGGNWTPTGFYVIIGAVCYVFQIYIDFSSCMDMIIGVAQMFGIKLPENFKTPFYSTNLSEFWRRWHITLGAWLKDYVMYPIQKALTTRFGKSLKKKLGKKASKDILLYTSMLATWFLIGLWHGGSWKFIFSVGLFFFVMIVGGLIFSPLFKKLTTLLRIDTDAWSWTLFCRLRTSILFIVSVSFGRAATLTDGFAFWKNAFVEYNPWIFTDGSLFNMGLDSKDFFVLLFGMMVLFIVSKYQQKGSVRENISKQNTAFRWVIWLALFAVVLMFGMYGEGYNPADFIYRGF